VKLIASILGWVGGVVQATESFLSTAVWTTATTALFSTASRTVVAGQWIMISIKTNVTHGATGGQETFGVYRSAGTALLLNNTPLGSALATSSPGSTISLLNVLANQNTHKSEVNWLYVSVGGTVTLSFTGTTTGSNAAASTSNTKVEFFR
jgi:hypothetical protein